MSAFSASLYTLAMSSPSRSGQRAPTTTAVEGSVSALAEAGAGEAGAGEAGEADADWEEEGALLLASAGGALGAACPPCPPLLAFLAMMMGAVAATKPAAGAMNGIAGAALTMAFLMSSQSPPHSSAPMPVMPES